MFIQILLFMNLAAIGAMKFMVIDILCFYFLHAVGQLQGKSPDKVLQEFIDFTTNT